MRRTILHVDMDAFFASVEQLDHPEWRGKAVIVGAGPNERGVVSTCSYEARRYGVHSAMPSRTACQLCPTAIFVPPRGERYQEVSGRAFEVFSHYSPFVEGVSIDEAFLDITGTLHLYGDDPAQAAVRLGEALRREIRTTCGVTCSVGIAPNRLLAKIGSEEHKPDGLTVMPFDAEAIVAFLAPRPIGILWGVGKKTQEALRPFGIATCGDLQRLPAERLAPLVGGREIAEHLRRHAFGISDDTVRGEEAEEKSVSREHTFAVDAESRSEVRTKLLELVSEVGFRFRSVRRWARTARLKVRDAQFRTFTRQAPFSPAARDDRAFRQKALELFEGVWPERNGEVLPGGVRLIGFGVTNIQNLPDESDCPLFEDPSAVRRERQERLSDALDALRSRGLLPVEPYGRAGLSDADSPNRGT